MRDLAPAKINLALHVIGRRPDGYHLIDSLVAFAGVGDVVTVEPADRESVLLVTGPEAAGVPTGRANSILRAADLMGLPVAAHLDKHLPSAAGIGGGSSDAAATLRAITAMTGLPLPGGIERLGADVPVCLLARAARMRGIGERVEPFALPPLPAVLVNPRRPLATVGVFAALLSRHNAPMPENLPPMLSAEAAIHALGGLRNDLEPAAIGLEPSVAEVLAALRWHPEVRLARMSGSGATCFGLCETPEAAFRVAGMIAGRNAGWWVRATVLR
jgi:4-diphosphocytidyl-2-C-methyl-D-erythritol kinase